MTSCGLIINYQRFEANLCLHPQRGSSRKSSWTTYMVSCPGRLQSATPRLSNFNARSHASFSEASDRSQPSIRTSGLCQISRDGAENKPILFSCVGVRWTHLPEDNSRDGCCIHSNEYTLTAHTPEVWYRVVSLVVPKFRKNAAAFIFKVSYSTLTAGGRRYFRNLRTYLQNCTLKPTLKLKSNKS
jgi:hypothetical protein